MGISSPLTWPVEGWYTTQGQQNRPAIALTDQPSSNTSSKFCFFCSLFFPVLWSKVKRGQEDSICEFSLNNIRPGAIFQLFVQHYGAHPASREVSRELAAGLHSATIDYHSIRLRLGSTASGRDAGEEKVPKHSIANRRNAPKAKMETRDWKIIYGRFLSISTLAENCLITVSQQEEKGDGASTFVLTKVWDWLRVINEPTVCRVFKEKRRQIQCHHNELI